MKWGKESPVLKADEESYDLMKFLLADLIVLEIDSGEDEWNSVSKAESSASSAIVKVRLILLNLEERREKMVE